MLEWVKPRIDKGNGMFDKLWRKKAVGLMQQNSSLHRSLTTFDLILMGIGAIIGAGVFVLTGVAAATKAGPGIVLSYSLAGMATMFAALSYAELASSIGGTGSAYSYAYAGFGEFIAWFIAWNLLLEYAMSVSTVAIGWSGYVTNLFQAFHINLPVSLTQNYFEGGDVNLLAIFIIAVCAIMLCIGVKASARFNAIVVFIKLATIAFFIIVASMNVNTTLWTPFLPFGWNGVIQGASLVFFAYIGFDALSTAVEEAIEPQRSIPIAIVTSLIICTIVYIVVSLLLTGIVPYPTLNVQSPVADALLNIGYRAAAGVIAAGAIAGLTTVVLMMYFGLTRVILAVASDGLLPKSISAINPNTRTPIRIIILSGIVMATVSGLMPIKFAAELVNIGTLAAFAFVCLGVVVFRYTHPDLNRPFKLPFNPIIPLLGFFSCLYLMYNLPGTTWWRFLYWSIAGILIYFAYGMRHSLLGKKQ